MKFEIALKEISWEKWLPFGVIMALLYYNTYMWLITNDWNRDDYSYGYLIPFVFAYLVWENRKVFMAAPVSTTWIGLIPVVTGVCLYCVGKLAGEIFTAYLSSWLIFCGVLLILFGWQKVRQIGFALMMLIFMFPLPHFINNKVTFQLKLMATKLGVWMLQAYNMPAYREGNVIDLGFTQLQVVDACSGLRYALPLLIMGLLVAYLSKIEPWKKIVIVVSTIPISVVVNGLRIASVGILYEYWGPAVAEGFFHDFSGWFIFMTSLAIMFGEKSILKRINILKEGERKKKSNVISGDGKLKTSDVGTPLNRISAFFKPPYFLIAMVLLTITLIFSQRIEFKEKMPITRPLEEFPMSIGSWHGNSKEMEQVFIDKLDLSDYTIINYTDGSNAYVNFYVAYYESQRTGESIHSPETCLPGSGWQFKMAGKINVPVRGPEGNTVIPVQRAVMQKGDFRQLSYFWFPMRGRILTNAYEMKFYNFWDALTRRRTDGALVRIITPVNEKEILELADARLQKFMNNMVPVLEKFLPQ